MLQHSDFNEFFFFFKWDEQVKTGKYEDTDPMLERLVQKIILNF